MSYSVHVNQIVSHELTQFPSETLVKRPNSSWQPTTLGKCVAGHRAARRTAYEIPNPNHIRMGCSRSDSFLLTLPQTHGAALATQICLHFLSPKRVCETLVCSLSLIGSDATTRHPLTDQLSLLAGHVQVVYDTR